GVLLRQGGQLAVVPFGHRSGSWLAELVTERCRGPTGSRNRGHTPTRPARIVSGQRAVRRTSGPPHADRRRSSSGATGSWPLAERDRKSTRLNSSHRTTSYAVSCLKKKTPHTLKTAIA